MRRIWPLSADLEAPAPAFRIEVPLAHSLSQDELLPLRSSTQLPMAISGGTVVTVVQASKPRSNDNSPARQRPTPASGRVFAQSEVSSIVVIVGDVIGKEAPEMLLVQNNNVVQQLAATTANPALRYSILPGTSH